MYKPNLVESLGRYVPNPPKYVPKVLPGFDLVAIIVPKHSKEFAVNVSHHFDYENYMNDFLRGHYVEFELYVVDALVLSKCRLEDDTGR
jgi:hypothetical protein